MANGQVGNPARGDTTATATSHFPLDQRGITGTARAQKRGNARARRRRRELGAEGVVIRRALKALKAHKFIGAT